MQTTKNNAQAQQSRAKVPGGRCSRCGKQNQGVKRSNRFESGTILRNRVCECGHFWQTEEILLNPH